MKPAFLHMAKNSQNRSLHSESVQLILCSRYCQCKRICIPAFELELDFIRLIAQLCIGIAPYMNLWMLLCNRSKNDG